MYFTHIWGLYEFQLQLEKKTLPDWVKMTKRGILEEWVHAISVMNHHVCEMHDMKESLLFPFAFPGGYLIFWSSQGLDSGDYSQVGSLLETYAFFWCILERGDHTQL
jgi:hypothetical protein